jgi:hypothetical protein
MKSKVLMLACGLYLMPLMATAQSPGGDAATPAPSRPAEPLRWRDGYVDWRGKFFKPDWQIFKAGDGTAFVVDMKSIGHVGSGSMRVVAYLVEEDDFNPSNLISFTFDCKGAFDVASKASMDRIRPVLKQVRSLACH